MVDTIATRLAAIDVSIADHHRWYLNAVWVDHPDEAAYHVAEVDRLLEVRSRVQRGPLTATTEPV